MNQIADYTQFNQPPFLIEYFKQDTDPVRLLAIQDQQYNELETVFMDMLLYSHIDTAVGEQLDNIGRILDVNRSGRSDLSYRTVLTGKAVANTKSGTPETLIEVIRKIFEATVINYIPQFPAGFKIQQNGLFQLFLYGELVVNTGEFLFLNTGEQLYYSEPDTISEQVVFDLAPAGVDMVIEQI